MKNVSQGDVLRVGGITHPVLVVSNQEFNQIMEVIVCPVLDDLSVNAIHPTVIIRQQNSEKKAYIACEHLRHLDLKARRYTKLGSVDYFQMMDISDILVALLEYR